jgi:parallel beta-helix repeat protein
MNRNIASIVLILVITATTLVFVGAAVAAAQGPAPQEEGGLVVDASPLSPAQLAYTYTTAITVTSGQDLDTSQAYTCYTGPSIRTPCTLRRAVVEARNVSSGQRPVLIRFNIPMSTTEGYDSSLGIWKINLLSTTDASVLRRLNGRIIIDGDTQPNGRATGPKIFLVGPTTGQKDGPVVGDVAGNDNHVIRGLGFQNFGTHMFVNTDNNLIENNWFGLNDQGTGVYLRANNPQDGSGSGGIDMGGGTGGAEFNTIQNNVFAGFDGVAVALRGGSNTFSNNYVGTQADGNVVKNANPALWCTTEDWLGGGGLSVEGISQRIENNIIAGLRQEIFVLSQQPDALRVTVTGITGHTIQNNRIGVDIDNTEVGACGRGIYLSGDMKNTLIAYNTIVNTRLSGLSLNDNLYDECTLRSNVIKQTNSWPAVSGNPKPEDAIQLGPLLPDGYEFFKPAKVTTINGTAASGVSGDSSACPNCVVELFLDDADAVTETLQSLAVVTATADGSWSATLPFALTTNQGVRTTSTSAQYGTIPNISKGTTTGLSALYRPTFKIFLPVVVRNYSSP